MSNSTGSFFLRRTAGGLLIVVGVLQVPEDVEIDGERVVWATAQFTGAGSLDFASMLMGGDMAPRTSTAIQIRMDTAGARDVTERAKGLRLDQVLVSDIMNPDGDCCGECGEPPDTCECPSNCHETNGGDA